MKATIVIHEVHQQPRRVTKVLTYPDGGFAVFAPYHSSRSGYLMMYDSSYLPRLQLVSPEASVKEYTAEDQVKLSYHVDGFAQFSSVSKPIMSGRDPETGEPRGMGLLSQPLVNPITSGPSSALVLWGLAEFEEFTRAKSGEETIIFGEPDFAGSQYSPHGWNAYVLEFFVLPNVPSQALQPEDGHYRAALAFFNFEVPGTVFVLRLLPLEAHNNMLGLLVRRIQHGFAASSGFTLNSPSQILSHDASSKSVRFMVAAYPDPASRGAPSIAFVPPESSP